MTEQEKMKQGYLWNDDDENIALQTRCKELVKQFNETPAGAFEEREALLHDIFGEVGENVWIGGNVFILPGVTIGDNSVIGAGSIVTKDIPANVIAVGNPCKVLREITDRDAEYYYGDRRFDEQPE